MVTFTTFKKTDDSLVAYRETGGQTFQIKHSKVTYFKDKKYKAYIHRVKLNDLIPGATYGMLSYFQYCTNYFYKLNYTWLEYRCKADNIWSNIFSFKVHNPETPLKVAIYGDLGLKNGVSTRQLIKDVEKGLYDTVFHIGLQSIMKTNDQKL